MIFYCWKWIFINSYVSNRQSFSFSTIFFTFNFKMKRICFVLKALFSCIAYAIQSKNMNWCESRKKVIKFSVWNEVLDKYFYNHRWDSILFLSSFRNLYKYYSNTNDWIRFIHTLVTFELFLKVEDKKSINLFVYCKSCQSFLSNVKTFYWS